MNFKGANLLKEWLLNLRRGQKKIILFTTDFVLFAVALLIAFALRIGILVTPQDFNEWIVFVSAPAIGVVSLYYSGVYRRITRHVGNNGSKRVLIGVSLSVLVWSLFVFLSDFNVVISRGVPRSVVVMYWAIAFLLIWISREFASWYLRGSWRFGGEKILAADQTLEKSILIWGYSETALQLMRDLRRVGNYYPAGIIDEDASLHFQKADNVKIYPPSSLENLIPKENVSEIYLDSEIVSRRKRFEIVRMLEEFPVVLKVLPSAQDIASGQISIDRIKRIKVEDLLGRRAVPPLDDLLTASVEDKVILVTGAGGSIGSELVRQLVLLGPVKLVLLELSEIALYHITDEMNELQNGENRTAENNANFVLPEIVPLIGSVTDADTVRKIIKQHGVQTIYHAAAYKHVLIVEDNPVSGIANNSFGTWTLANAAKELGVERFVLVSTDKAVRPTNVMGASKRLAEMVLQGIAAEKGCKTVFTMVRFGNVLDSSGSVVPRFRKQIEQGGPITVTHPDVIRYFMSISEAVGLVIQAGTLAKAGAVFVLDMGKPVKILELAQTMIQLAGQRIKDENNPNGDIEIEFTGLQTGEKLYEELLIGENTSPTRHPRISQLDEPYLPIDKLEVEMASLKEKMDQGDVDGIKAILKKLVEGYTTTQ